MEAPLHSVSREGLLNTSDAADRLGVSTRTLWGISAPRGPLPVVRIGDRVLYAPADIAAYIAAATVRKDGGK